MGERRRKGRGVGISSQNAVAAFRHFHTGSSELRSGKKGLFDLGYNLQWTYFADGLDNPTGGVRQGAAYEGILYMVLDADLAKIASLDGLSFRVNAYQIHGGHVSASNLFNLATVDSIEALPTTLLFELWLEQKL